VVPVRDGVVVNVKVTPRARQDRIDPPGPDQALRVRVTAPADDGKANAAVIALLAKSWDLPRSAFSITTGATSRRKRIHIQGEPAALIRRLTTHTAAP